MDTHFSWQTCPETCFGTGKALTYPPLCLYNFWNFFFTSYKKKENLTDFSFVLPWGGLFFWKPMGGDCVVLQVI